jgi:DNA polymerase V
LPVTKVWGIANRLGKRLTDHQIYSAWDLASSNPKMIRRISSVSLEKTIEELNGRPCFALEESPPAKKQIYCTRSFGERLTELEPIQQAVALYTRRGIEKLRLQQHLALTVHVFIHTSPFEPHFYSKSQVVQLPYPTDDVRVITKAANQAVANLFKSGHRFVKAGIGLIELVDKRFHQFDLLEQGQSEQADHWVTTIDRINKRFGKGTIHLGSEGFSKKWAMRQHYTSPAYTTRWTDIPIIKC